MKYIIEMTHEEFQQKLKDTPNLELLEMAQSALSKLCSSGGKSFTMTVPPRKDDTDILFGEVINRLRQYDRNQNSERPLYKDDM